MSKNKTIMKQTKISETSGSVPEFIQKLFRYFNFVALSIIQGLTVFVVEC